MTDFIDTPDQQNIPVDTTPIAPIISAMSGGGPQANIAASKLINKKIEDDTVGHANTQTQWAPLIVNVLAGNMGSALKYFNGGPTREVEAYGPSGDKYIKEYNQRGVTGRVFDAQGNQLSVDKIKELDKVGLISSEDLTPAQKGEFQAGVTNETAAAAALRNPALAGYQAAQRAAVTSAGVANLYQERSNIAKNSKWLDTVQNLSPEKRSALFQVISSQSNISSGTTTETGKTGSASAGGQAGQGKTQSISGEAGFGVNPAGVGAGGTSVNGPKIGGAVGAGGSAFTQGQVSGSAGASNQAGTTSSTGNQLQSNLKSQIESLLQSKLDDKDFSNMQRYIQISNQIDQSNAKRQTDQIVPGVTPVPQQDYLTSGRRNSVLADIQGMKNEALTAAWNKFLAQKTHQLGGTPFNIGLAGDEFLQTPVAEGINNRFDGYAEEVKTGKKHEPKEGSIYVDNKNNPMIIRNGKPEKFNGR